ncbi:MAG: aspartate aminotransferase family protein [Candidatus Eremiobacteraeota bacterium]|nr:aspartate aminotransferase family protein [Candidatus Eremiobacteraeota bacterium]
MSAFERLQTEIPGPRSRELAGRLGASESRGVAFLSHDFPTFWERATGATVSDVDGNRYLDLSAAFGVALTGHANAAVVEAIAAQSHRLPHAMGDVHPAALRVTLLERLTALAPIERAKAYLCTSGTESIEFARKTALLFTGRPNALAFTPSYHGLGYGALEVTGMERFRAPFAAQLRRETTFVPFPDRRDGGALDRTAALVEAALRDDPTIGCVIVEPIAGRGGVIVPPDGFLRTLRRVCDERRCVLIADEIFTGFGRTGTRFAVDYEAVAPDILCIGKALAGGFPMAATIARADVMDAWPPSSGEALHTSTYLGNPMGCAAALANLDEMERLHTVIRAGAIGGRLAERLTALVHLGFVRDVRGRGALWGVECDTAERVRDWTIAALKRGLIVLPAGQRGEVLQLSPPLVIDDTQLGRALDLLEAAAPA